jgi:hypothetical protein
MDEAKPVQLSAQVQIRAEQGRYLKEQVSMTRCCSHLVRHRNAVDNWEPYHDRAVLLANAEWA